MAPPPRRSEHHHKEHGISRLKRLFSRSRSTLREPYNVDSRPLGKSASSVRLDSGVTGDCSASGISTPAEHGRTTPAAVNKDSPNHTAVPHLQSSVDEVAQPERGEPSVSGSAYDAAWNALKENERHELTSGTDIKSIFEQLKEDNETHRENSIIRKGLSKAAPWVKKLSRIINVASPFASLEPTAGTAMGLVKGATTIIIAVCGAAETLSDDIEMFLERIPAIDRCDGIAKDGALPDIHHALVEMYTALLEFDLKVAALFRQSNFNAAKALFEIKSKTAGSLDAFNKQAKALNFLLDCETFASVLELKQRVDGVMIPMTQELMEGMVDTLIRDTLHIGDSQLNEVNNHRSDEACRWIDSNPSLSSWASASPDARILVLTGNMGCGKTMTSAYVFETFLPNHRTVKTNSKTRPIVCGYYCRETEGFSFLNFFRSILRQLLDQKPDLKPRFWQWQKAPCRGGTTQLKKTLRDFLFSAFLSSPEPVFVVVDGLDECSPADREALLELFGSLLEGKADLRVFLSSRYYDEIRPGFHTNAIAKVEMQSSKERDRLVASYLIRPTSVPRELHRQAVDELTDRADGSAIWIYMAIQFLHASCVAEAKDLEEAWDELPSSSSGLAMVYLNLYEKSCACLPRNKVRLRLALETLAVARQPLTPHELACAVYLNTKDLGLRSYTTVADLEQKATPPSLMKLIRPFVKMIPPEGGDGSQIRLIHKSLNELIAWGTPEEWDKVGTEVLETRQSRQSDRQVELHKRLLHCCIKYLLLEDCGELSLVSNLQHDTEDEDFMSNMDFGVFTDTDREKEVDDPLANLELSRTFNPVQLGLGHFFTYAASYWTDHFSKVLDLEEHRPKPSELIELCRPSSQRLSNWVYQWRRPNCTRWPENELPVQEVDLDPLVVTAMFGPAASLADLLQTDIQPGDFLKESVWTAIKELIKRRHISSIKKLVDDPKVGPILRHPGFFFHIVPGWSERPYANFDDEHQESRLILDAHQEEARLKAENAQCWEDIFNRMIHSLRPTLLGSGNEVLCLAARNGCLVLVKGLFKAGETDPEMMAAILADHRKRSGKQQRTSTRDFHQSIGEAVWEGHVKTVDFLCKQPGTEDHLRYINHNECTVFHQWARLGNPEIFKILFHHWPEGVHRRNDAGDTLIHEYIFGCPRHDPNVIPTLRMLVRLGKVDMSGKHDKEWLTPSPLQLAAQGGKVNVCRFLITEGSADIWSLLEIDDTTKKPCLKVSSSSPGVQKELDDAELLKELCSIVQHEL